MAGAPNAMCLVKGRGQGASIHPPTHQGEGPEAKVEVSRKICT